MPGSRGLVKSIIQRCTPQSLTKADGNRAEDIPYRYQSVEASQIRCIRLGHPRGDDHQSGFLQSCEREIGGFTALSYEWGSPIQASSSKILISDTNIEDAVLPVTKNLSNALRDLGEAMKDPINRRLYAAGNSFFIDQISINQNDNLEKSIQVANMSDVYKFADEVIVYLGLSEHGDSKALTLLSRIDDYFGSWFDELAEVYDINFERYQRSGKDLTYLQSFKLSFSDQKTLQLLFELVYNTGWTQRLWMTQEVLLNKKLIFLRGSRFISGRSILLLPSCQLLQFLRPMSDPDIKLVRQALAISIDRLAIHKRMHFRTLLENIKLTGPSLACSDPKDRVFALLGVSADNWGIRPRYDVDNDDVYIDLVKESINQTQTLQVLNCVVQTSSKTVAPKIPTKRDRWPSWVPAFETAPGDFDQNRASGLLMPQVSYISKDKIFSTKGYQIAEIETVIGLFDELRELHYGRSPKAVQAFIAIVERARKLLKMKGVLNIEEKLCYTLRRTYDSPDSEWSNAEWRNCAGQAFNAMMEALASRASKVEVWSRAKTSLHLLRNFPEVPQGYPEVEIDQDLSDEKANFARKLLNNSHFQWRALGMATTGDLVLANLATEVGDILTVLHGGSETYVLRPGESQCYTLIGPAFIDGYMNGETLHDIEWEGELRGAIVDVLKNGPVDLVSTGVFTDQVVWHNIQCQIKRWASLAIGTTPLTEDGSSDDSTSLPGGGIQSFLSASDTEQLGFIRAVLVKEPTSRVAVGMSESKYWRESWWRMIELMVQNGLLSRQPTWEQRSEIFYIQ